MLAAKLLLLAILYAPTHAFMECYPNSNCTTGPRADKIVIPERHEGFNGIFTLFPSVQYCRSGKSTWNAHSTLCKNILDKGNCGDCHGIDPGECVNSPGDGAKFVCAYSA